MSRGSLTVASPQTPGQREPESAGYPKESAPNRRCALISLLVLLAAGGVAITLYFAISEATKPAEVAVAANTSAQVRVEDKARVTCLPDFYGKAPLRYECIQRNCIWDETPNIDVPCYLDSVTNTRRRYVVTSKNHTSFGQELRLAWEPSGTRAVFSSAIASLRVEIHHLGLQMFRIKITDADKNRYEVPVNLNIPHMAMVRENERYEVETADKGQSFYVTVRRSGSKTVIFDSRVADLLFENQFISMSVALPSHNIYGFGENIHPTFRHNTSYKSWPMWARDQPPSWQPGANLYGTHPFYVCIENDTNSHGVLLMNSNAMDYSFSPLPMLTYRTIGGILDFFIFLGPTPENVVQQYTNVVGRPYMPPYWALGFHLCRYGYKNTNEIREAVWRTQAADIPHDVQYADIDYMDGSKDFTVDSANFGDLANYFRDLQQTEKMRTVIMLDPALAAVQGYPPYDQGFAKDIFITWPGIAPCDNCSDAKNNMLGYVWPKDKVVFPDFFKNDTRQLWKDWIVNFSKTLPFDGLWIDMNEPANFGTNEAGPIFNWDDLKRPWSLKCNMSLSLENPPYKTMAVFAHSRSASISDKTICMVGQHNNAYNGKSYSHYDVHNLYGWSQTEITLESLRSATRDKRGMVITRSTFPGSGKYAGHWLGDNESTWKDLRDSIIGMLEFNLFGIPYVGADICGFFGNATAELCQRWMELGAFYPYSRNHNQKEAHDQDPGWFDDRRVAAAARDALKIRYQLLPYLYTLFHYAHTRGDTVVRSMAQEWPGDATGLAIDTQFLWGPALLITPILHQGQTKLSYYLPQGTWYNYYFGNEQRSGQSTMDVNRDTRIQLHIRGGHVLPTKLSASKNTYYSRRTPFSLTVALDENSEASGSLFWDDGESVDTYSKGKYVLFKLRCKESTLHLEKEQGMNFKFEDETEELMLASVTVLGVRYKPRFVYVGATQTYSFSYDDQSKKLVIYSIHLDLLEKDHTEITWSDNDNAHAKVGDRVDCLPHLAQMDQTREICVSFNCTWDQSSTVINQRAPWCYLDKNVHQYTVASHQQTPLTRITLQPPTSKSYTFGGILSDSNPVLIIEELSSSILHFKFELNDTPRDSIPVPLQSPPSHGAGAEKLYVVEYENRTGQEFHLKVLRRSSNKAIFDTSIGGLFLSSQFQQIVTRLPTTNVYGFGENDHETLKHSNNYETWPMFARDQPPGAGHSNLYGVHPFYLCIDDTQGNSHGVLLWNSNAMEYKFQPDPSLSLRTIGGKLEFYVFLGPTPDNVIQQYTSLIGRPLLPPYWSLGFQLCRYGYNSIEEMKAAVNRTLDAGIPLDVQYADIDHMDEQKDFTIDKVRFPALRNYTLELRRKGINFIIILDPALLVNESYDPYKRGKDGNVYVTWPDGYNQDSHITKSNAMAGYVWPNGYAVFPDFFKTATKTFWKDEIRRHYDSIYFDGLWIDMNEPANFGTEEDRPWNWPEDRQPWWSLKCPKNSSLERPPYKPRSIFGNTLSDKTLCMVAKQGNRGEFNHYDVHNLYGWSQSQPTLEAVEEATRKRGIVISRSTFPGSGQFVGHWLGDNSATWKHMKQSIIGIIEFNLFGIPYIGADICGFFGDSDPELCQRWMQLGAFYTYSRNHNGLGYKPQDPAVFGSAVAASSKKALDTRYHLLPYLYTLFYEAHTQGTPVIKALWHEYPSDANTWSIDEQFLWGKHLLITPVLRPGKTTVEGYFPGGKWYNYYTGEVQTTSGREFIELSAPRDTIPLHVRGGAILPRQAPGNNTLFSRQNAMDLLVALDESENATGSLFWDDGVSTDTIGKSVTVKGEFLYTNGALSIAVNKNTGTPAPTIDKVIVYGFSKEPKVKLQGATLDGVKWDSSTKVLHVPIAVRALTDLTLNFELEG